MSTFKAIYFTKLYVNVNYLYNETNFYNIVRINNAEGNFTKSLSYKIFMSTNEC